MQRHHEEPDAKKAKASDPAFPTLFLDDLTTVLAAALGTNKGTHGSTVVEASTTSMGRNCLEPAPAPKAKAKPAQVGFYPSVNPNVDPYKYQTVTAEERRKRDVRNAKEIRRKKTTGGRPLTSAFASSLLVVPKKGVG